MNVDSPKDPDLIKITEVFLVPSSFLVAALGTADTNLHRAAVSLIGLVVSALWWVCSWEALAERRAAQPDASMRTHTFRTRIMAGLAIFFVACWALSLAVHAWLWNQPLGK